jgi:hypothetical protein
MRDWYETGQYGGDLRGVEELRVKELRVEG